MYHIALKLFLKKQNVTESGKPLLINTPHSSPYFCPIPEVTFFFKFLLLFNYSCMPFLPIPAPHPS